MAFMKTLTHRAWLAMAAGLWTGLAAAGTSSAFMDVSITLNNPNAVVPSTRGGSAPGLIVRPAACLSETLNEQANAVVRVVCDMGQFVSIVPTPGKPFPGTYGGALRYTLGAGRFTTGQQGQAMPFFDAGTVTALRIYNASSSNRPLEMLVSF